MWYTKTEIVWKSVTFLEMINMNAFNFKYSEGDLLIMSYMERYPDNTKEKLQEIWGESFEVYAEEYELDEDDDGENIVGIGEPLDGGGGDSEVHQCRIRDTVAVAGEDELPCGEDVTCQSRRVEDVCKHSL